MRKKSRKRRGISRFIILGLLLLAIAYGIWIGLTMVLKRMDLFRVKKIEIVGSKNLDKNFLKNLSREFIGKNLFDIPTSDILVKYDNIIRVKKVDVNKKLPDVIEIKITERIGILYVKSMEGDFLPIDEDKIVLDKADFYFSEDLPVVSLNISNHTFKLGEKIQDKQLDRIIYLLRKIQKIDPVFLTNISEFYIFENEVYFVDSQNGCRVILGEDDLDDKIKRFLFLRSNKGFERNSIVDLRYKNQIIVR